MRLSLIIFAVINLIFILGFAFGLFFVYKKDAKPKLVAHYSLFLTSCMAFYLASIIAILACAAYFKNYLSFLYVVFLLLPFVIGKFATYKRLSFYTSLHIAMLCLSFMATLFAIY